MQYISVKDFGGVGDGIADDTIPLQDAIAAGLSAKLPVLIDGHYLFTSQLTLPTGVMLKGTNNVSDATPGVYAPSTLIKDFNGSGVVLSGDDTALENLQVYNLSGNTGDNIVMSGSRTRASRVTSTNAGQDGFRVGSDVGGANANLWYIENCMSFNNGRHGLYINDALAPTDAGGGVCNGFDARANNGDGVNCDNCTWNTFTGVVSQFNDGYGFRLTAGARSITVVGGDLEANVLGQGILEANSFTHVIIGQFYASNATWVDNSGLSERNVLIQYRNNAAVVSYGTQLSVVDPNLGGAPQINFFSDTAETHSAYISAQQTGVSGGQLNIRTKRDGGVLSAAVAIDSLQRTKPQAAFLEKLPVLTYGATVNTDASLGNQFQLSVNDGVAFAIAAPTNAAEGQVATYVIRNISGGVMGAVTWNAIFKLAAWVNPANGFSRSITFRYDGANWIEISRTPSDVPN
jgi:hypothetical protein